MFSVQSKKIVDPGFTSVMTRLKIEEEESLDGFNEGNNIPVKSASLIELETGPPGYLTESELITLMEKYRIGTDASISVHINNICVESGRRLVPTKLGIALIQGFFQVDHELIEPTMRADVEKQLNLIALGKADYKDVKDHTLEMFRKKFLYYVEHVEQVDVLFQGLFTSLADSGKPFSRCGKCRRFMKMIETKPQRLFCLNCQETYSLPAVGGGDIRLCGERKCPIDEFDLLYVSGKLAKSFAFCPHCFNHPPNILNGMRKGVGCNECPHPGCSNSYIAQGVMPCLTECNNGEGVLVLDSMSGPKWRLTCNKCSAFLPLFEGAWKLKVLETDCAKCGAHTEGKSKLPNSELKYTGCIWCEREKLGTCCVNLNHAYLSKDPKISGNTRGRGGGRRGRGRGKRGRG